jgi:hypothetical protein
VIPAVVPGDLVLLATSEVIAPVQWVVLILLVLLFVFDVEKRGESKRDLQRAQATKNPTEILAAETLVKMNTADVLGVPCFIAWLVLRHEHLPPAADMQALALGFFCLGLSLILVKRFYERSLRNKLCR